MLRHEISKYNLVPVDGFVKIDDILQLGDLRGVSASEVEQVRMTAVAELLVPLAAEVESNVTLENAEVDVGVGIGIGIGIGIE